ncbi:MAG: hypothetical protein P8014_18095, partial [Acidihalobacter sp.]|uniref:hypothetical protein n=1 Tax=Acidihalobacter sp. TaxID=1872108 RepID=UPI00307E3FE2
LRADHLGNFFHGGRSFGSLCRILSDHGADRIPVVVHGSHDGFDVRAKTVTGSTVLDVPIV